MNCVRGHYVPDHALVCPECTSRQGDEALYAMQGEFLRKAADGNFGYTLRVAKLPARHVLLYSSQIRTFCGTELKAKPRIDYEPYRPDVLARICPGCRSEITRALEEAQ